MSKKKDNLKEWEKETCTSKEMKERKRHARKKRKEDKPESAKERERD